MLARAAGAGARGGAGGAARRQGVRGVADDPPVAGRAAADACAGDGAGGGGGRRGVRAARRALRRDRRAAARRARSTRRSPIGDFVVSGGELPALMLIDAIVRQLPGVLNDARVGARRIRSPTGCSTVRTTRGRRCTTAARCPTVLLSGNHAAIRALAAEAGAGQDVAAAAGSAAGPDAVEGRGGAARRVPAGSAGSERQQ